MRLLVTTPMSVVVNASDVRYVRAIREAIGDDVFLLEDFFYWRINFLRDPAGEIKGFTGIDDPYEAPEAPEITLLAAEKSPEVLADEVIAYLRERQIIGGGQTPFDTDLRQGQAAQGLPA